jgi:transposase-like protein
VVRSVVYLYPAAKKAGRTVDFLLGRGRNIAATKRYPANSGVIDYCGTLLVHFHSDISLVDQKPWVQQMYKY